VGLLGGYFCKFGSGMVPKGQCIESLVSNLALLGSGGTFKRQGVGEVAGQQVHALEGGSRNASLLILFLTS
jgi:hypothetical protein